MYVLTYNNQVFLTPTSWKPRYISSVIEQDYDVEIILTISDEQRIPFNITPEIRVYKVEEAIRPEINPLIEDHDGPLWTISEDRALATYTVRKLPLELVKTNIKSLLAAERYKRECSSFKTTINDTEITVETDRATRSIFMEAVLFMNDAETRNWKFPEGWLNISKANLMSVILSGAAKIQGDFDWEEGFVSQIDSAKSLEDLVNIHDNIFPKVV